MPCESTQEECEYSASTFNQEYGECWYQQTQAGNRTWISITTSIDGVRMIAADSDQYLKIPGMIYSSADSGTTWVPEYGAGIRMWSSVASSYNGSFLAATDSGQNASHGGYIYTSNDGGLSWIQCTSAGKKQWVTLAISSNGIRMAACEISGPDNGATKGGGFCHTSSDYGETWVVRNQSSNMDQLHNWQGIASSADGLRLTAVDYNGYHSQGGYIYTSEDGGDNWIEQTRAGAKSWISIASSSDGNILIAADRSGGYGGYLYYSYDGGFVWEVLSAAGSRNWQAVTCSTNGTMLAAAEYSSGSNVTVGGLIYTSDNEGQTWTTHSQLGYRNWNTIVTSGYGTAIAAGVYNGYIYTASYCDCPTGTYAVDEFQSQCTQCPSDMHNDIAGSLSCQYCTTPYTSLKVGETTCDAYCLNVSTPAVGGIAGIFMLIFFSCLLTLRRPAKIALTFAIILVPAMDFILDFLYILSVQFVDDSLFNASLFILLFSMVFQLARSLSRKDVSVYSYLHTMFPIRQKTLILGQKYYRGNYCRGSHESGLVDSHDYEWNI